MSGCDGFEYEQKPVKGFYAFRVEVSMGKIKNLRELKAFLKKNMGVEYLRYHIYKNKEGALLFRFYDGMLSLARYVDYREIYGLLEDGDVLLCSPSDKWLARVSGEHFAIYFERMVTV